MKQLQNVVDRIQKTGFPASGKIRESQGEKFFSGKSGKVREFASFFESQGKKFHHQGMVRESQGISFLGRQTNVSFSIILCKNEYLYSEFFASLRSAFLLVHHFERYYYVLPYFYTRPLCYLSLHILIVIDSVTAGEQLTGRPKPYFLSGFLIAFSCNKSASHQFEPLIVNTWVCDSHYARILLS